MTSAVNKLQVFFSCTFHQKPRKAIISYTDVRTNVLCFQLQVYFWLINWWKHANILPPLQCFKLDYPHYSCLSCPLFGSTELIPNPQQSAGSILSTLHWHTEQHQRMVLKKGSPCGSSLPTPKNLNIRSAFPLQQLFWTQELQLERKTGTLRNLHTTDRHGWHGHRPICNTTQEWSVKPVLNTTSGLTWVQRVLRSRGSSSSTYWVAWRAVPGPWQQPPGESLGAGARGSVRLLGSPASLVYGDETSSSLLAPFVSYRFSLLINDSIHPKREKQRVISSSKTHSVYLNTIIWFWVEFFCFVFLMYTLA